MPSVLQPIVSPVLVVAVLMAAGSAMAGPGTNDDGRRWSNSTTLVYSVAAPSPTVVRPQGASVPPSTPVVRNPYHVPLIQGAGSLRLGR
jgi:hypothetical protein